MTRRASKSRGQGPVNSALVSAAIAFVHLACAAGPDSLSPHRPTLRAPGDPESATAWPSWEPAAALLAAADDPSRRVNPFLPWPPAPADEAPTPGSLWGLELGLAAPEHAGWAASPRVGVFHERLLTSSRSGDVWLAAGLTGSREEDRPTSLDLIVVRARLGLVGGLAADRSLAGGAFRFRPLWRLAVVYEWAGIADVDMSFDRYALLGSVGIEGASSAEPWSVRVEYCLVAGESDAEGELFAGLFLRL